MYRIPSNRHWANIGGEHIFVDSNLEEKILSNLEATGFAERWRRLEHGLNVGANNYTPDLELSVQHDGLTHRALVEIKPYKQAFTPYISERMRGVAKHYATNLLLLYADKENTWYRVDIKTGELENFGVPIPGMLPISKLYKPITLPAKRVYNHTYVKKFRPVMGALNLTAKLVADSAEAIVVGPKKLKHRRTSRRKKR